MSDSNLHTCIDVSRLQDVDQPGSQIDFYVERMNALLSVKLANVKEMQVCGFWGHPLGPKLFSAPSEGPEPMMLACLRAAPVSMISNADAHH